MSSYTHQTAPTQFVEASGIRFAYRLFGKTALEASGSGVRVNAVAPGPIDTAMLTRFTGTDERKAGLIAGVPLKRFGKPEEIAESIVFLSSEKASFITGATIAVDGGKTAL